MKTYTAFALLILVLLTSCGTFEVSVADPTSANPANPVSVSQPAPSPVPNPQPILVAYVQDGNIQLWDQLTQQSKTVFVSGDVTLAAISDDSQVIAFTRGARVEQPELMEQFSLWAVNRDGSNPRQLVSPDALRQRLEPSATDSIGFAQIEWIPGSHRLVYSLIKYYLPGQGSSYSRDIYAVDAGTGADDVLAANVLPADTLDVSKMVPSPDGAQLALLTLHSLSFVSTDGRSRRDNVLTYPDVGRGDEPTVLAAGVWTQDARSFILAAPDSLDEQFNIKQTFWRIPVDGGAPESLASVERSHPLSVTFSPAGDRFAYIQDKGPAEALSWLIGSFPSGLGPLALPPVVDFGSYANLHWSPGGAVFTRDLIQLCQGAASDSDMCDRKFELGTNNIQSVRWIDGSRLLVLTREPPVLFYAVDGERTGTALPIVAWAQPEQSHSYSAAFAAP